MSEKNMLTQKVMILEYMKNGNRITPLEALNQFNCMALAQRIYDLRKDGHIINRRMFRTHTGKNVAQYSYVKKN